MFSKIVYVILIIISFISCVPIQKDRICIARTYDECLYLDQIPSIPNSLDSVLFVQQFTNNWAIQKILLKKAEFNFKNHPNYIDSLLNVYRQSLLIHYYKEALIQENLDTIISDSLVLNYYENYVENFRLKEDIVKINYVKIRDIAPNINFLVKNFSTINKQNIDTIQEYCFQFAERFSLDSNNWISWVDFSKQLPIEGNYIFNQTRALLKKKSNFELNDSIYKYLISIEDFCPKGTSSPLEYVSSTIKSILINKRKKELINSIEYELFEEAVSNNNFEFYE
tara:strand:- start:98 stop:943 length:846 start_codon:yes stop_codon:yes gene_type:complete